MSCPDSKSVAKDLRLSSEDKLKTIRAFYADRPKGDVAFLLDIIEQEHAALRKYGRHFTTCPRRRAPEGSFPHCPCECGFSDAMR
jgi:hypothetical protein